MRPLRKEELDLITHLLKDKSDYINFINSLPHIMVEDMNDGGMGSLKFLSKKNNRRMKNEIANIDLRDIDGISLSITINTDIYDELFELDVFKADFSPLKQFPLPPYKF